MILSPLLESLLPSEERRRSTAPNKSLNLTPGSCAA